ncbi:hypothetical protein L596_006489 [Steinernema carpocapsae]|uniref:G-protein coupled receptors family 1 profile domain-containing protein n=1 Tax=Steinernema carpocapsae TaxID=34508 RepID=A0A4U8V280_STECR|nr:hypothetical protein L596_006489 [Steinernema carpocapsae]
MWMFGMVTFIDQMMYSEFANPIKWLTRERTFVLTLIYLVIFVGLIVAPSLFYIKLKQVIVYEEYGEITNFRIDTYSCSTILPKHLSLYVNGFALIFDFIVPILLVIILLTVLIGRVNARRPQTNYLNQWKINSFIILLASLHFLAYLPHWTAILLLFVAENWSMHIPDWMLVALRQLVLIFPHLTAAFAWIPLSNLSTLLGDRARNVCSESFGKLTRPKRQPGTWVEESCF